ncbi:MAG: hypothetical protein ACFFC7_28470, partial [Candidatus Hermodarchaeota archaeon]
RNTGRHTDFSRGAYLQRRDFHALRMDLFVFSLLPRSFDVGDRATILEKRINLQKGRLDCLSLVIAL